MKNKHNPTILKDRVCNNCRTLCSIYSFVYIETKPIKYNKTLIPRKRIFMCHSCWIDRLKRYKRRSSDRFEHR